MSKKSWTGLLAVLILCLLMNACSLLGLSTDTPAPRETPALEAGEEETDTAPTPRTAPGRAVPSASAEDHEDVAAEIARYVMDALSGPYVMEHPNVHYDEPSETYFIFVTGSSSGGDIPRLAGNFFVDVNDCVLQYMEAGGQPVGYFGGLFTVKDGIEFRYSTSEINPTSGLLSLNGVPAYDLVPSLGTAARISPGDIETFARQMMRAAGLGAASGTGIQLLHR